ncbi:protein phosphatase CheZ [Teredinibacter sp. KSP-S5-2]|uniref:protein phosphatase CheZ n=1 Tax=Teredinibacter sp. KSP-S5-2 TaxID=3034506 RepID=UPI002934E996|nr:protein phosphatase CheZ [Teredinibacter sp. KSP-S5-2]WNO07891.1 protein phosphatase CheZ [Teredinibacter sp. KSP-S5-2]
MDSQVPLHENQQFQLELQLCAKQLVDTLQNDNFEKASQLIHDLIEARDSHIFNSVGQLTRALHSAIVNFHVDAVLEEPPEKNSDIRDASDRLHYVISLTQKAADQTMDKVEACAPIAMNLGLEAEKLKEDWSKLRRREMSKDEFKELYTRVDDFLEQLSGGTSLLNQNLQEIILEQGFQDLTGQVLKKVIGLITDVEKELVSLMRIADQVEKVTGLTGDDQEALDTADNVTAEGPQIHAEKREDVVKSQDDVDDLLSSLGF